MLGADVGCCRLLPRAGRRSPRLEAREHPLSEHVCRQPLEGHRLRVGRHLGEVAGRPPRRGGAAGGRRRYGGAHDPQVTGRQRAYPHPDLQERDAASGHTALHGPGGVRGRVRAEGRHLLHRGHGGGDAVLEAPLLHPRRRPRGCQEEHRGARPRPRRLGQRLVPLATRGAVVQVVAPREPGEQGLRVGGAGRRVVLLLHAPPRARRPRVVERRGLRGPRVLRHEQPVEAGGPPRPRAGGHGAPGRGVAPGVPPHGPRWGRRPRH
mmetsp:Transcript_17972/g.51196  ORF Transcript_17972/g.51196 Transcript_17972/m.51196 type:complete len:265 (+) Transcript_17972:80-874(+)